MNKNQIETMAIMLIRNNKIASLLKALINHGITVVVLDALVQDMVLEDNIAKLRRKPRRCR